MLSNNATTRSEKQVVLEERFLLRFNLFGVDRKSPRDELGPLQVMMFEPEDGSRRHTWAHPIENGLYELAVPVPGSGPCYLFFACPKSGMGYADLPHLILQTSVAGITLLRKPAEPAPADRACEAPAA